MALSDHISDFLRDGQYRLAEITHKLKTEIYDPDSREYIELNEQRLKIWALLNMLYYGYLDIYQGNFGFAESLEDWSEFEIISEIEHVRSETEVSEIPWASFATFQRVLVTRSGSSEEETDPTNLGGLEDQMAVYDSGGRLFGEDKPVNLGWIVPDIADYFANNAAWSRVLIPQYTAAEWSGENPTLAAGQIGIEQDDNGLALRLKIGPGIWKDLEYFNNSTFEDSVSITNPIGDASGDLSGVSAAEILKLMLSPYQVPVISELKNNAGGTYNEENIINLGESISGTISLQFSVANDANLDGSTPINVNAGGVFSNEGDFANGQIDLTLASTLTPTLLTNIEIKVKATHTNGETEEVSTFIRFQPQIIWGVSPNTSLTASEIANIPQKQTLVTDEYRNEYEFTAAGYLYLCIPSTLDPQNVIFADKTNELIPLPVEMTDLGVVANVNNGFGTYNYQVFRTTHSITSNSSKIEVG